MLFVILLFGFGKTAKAIPNYYLKTRDFISQINLTGIKIMPQSTNAKWNPPFNRINPLTSKTRMSVIDMKIGDVKRILHDDLVCVMKHGRNKQLNCSLIGIISAISKKYQRKFEYYHEKEHIAIVRRLS